MDPILDLKDCVVNPFLAEPCTSTKSGCYDAPPMSANAERKRPIVLPAFGRFLERLRLSSRPSRWGTKQTEKAARAEGLTLVTHNRLVRLEQGTVSDVPAAFLREAAKVYRQPYERLVIELVQEKYGVTLGVAHVGPKTIENERSGIDATDELGDPPSRTTSTGSLGAGPSGGPLLPEVSTMTKEERSLFHTLGSIRELPTRVKRAYFIQLDAFASRLKTDFYEGQSGKRRRGGGGD